MRDARIAAIYEGTNGIQAIDLVTRKLPLSGGETVAARDRRRARDRGQGRERRRRGLRRDRDGLGKAADALEAATGAMAGWLKSDPDAALAGASHICACSA